jgi:excisionase family DNA binding protein
MGRLVPLAELAMLTGTCEATWRKKIARGELPVVRIGRSIRVAEEVVQEILERGLVTPADPAEACAR